MISVIIPVYNTAPYLDECLRSVANQTYSDLEILTVNDASSDGSGELLQKWREADKRIRVFDNAERSGVSAARNLALLHAKGEYVYFLDSDDIIHPRTIEEQLRAASAFSADLVSIQAVRFTDETAEQLALRDGWDSTAFRFLSYDSDDALCMFSSDRKHDFNNLFGFYGIGGKLIRHSLLDGLLFDSDLAIGEDTLFLYRLFDRGIRISVSDVCAYYYRKRARSALSSQHLCYSNGRLETYRRIRNMEAERARSDEFVRYWDRSWLNEFRRAFIVLYPQRRIDQAAQELQRLHFMYLEETKRPDYRRRTIRVRIVNYLVVCHTSLYISLKKIKSSLTRREYASGG